MSNIKPKKIFDEIPHLGDNDSLQLFIGEDNQFYAYYFYTSAKGIKLRDTLKIVERMGDETKTSLCIEEQINSQYPGLRDIYIREKRLLKLEQL